MAAYNYAINLNIFKTVEESDVSTPLFFWGILAGAVSGCGFSLSDLKDGKDCRPKGMRTGEFIFWGNG